MSKALTFNDWSEYNLETVEECNTPLLDDDEEDPNCKDPPSYYQLPEMNKRPGKGVFVWAVFYHHVNFFELFSNKAPTFFNYYSFFSFQWKWWLVLPTSHRSIIWQRCATIKHYRLIRTCWSWQRRLAWRIAKRCAYKSESFSCSKMCNLNIWVNRQSKHVVGGLLNCGFWKITIKEFF